ncbi:MAG: chromate transporter [Lachnospiraceae bacterium]|nr:chromate transporter [Lachnospiraceae bacterium]
MIYLELLLGFLAVGLFSFGGAYGAIPLIRDVVLYYEWLDEEVIMDMIAVSESTPGPITVNLATYVGCSKAGVPGGIIATLAVILPAFFFVLLIMVVLKKLLENKYVRAVIDGLMPCVIGIIAATGCYMLLISAFYPFFGEEHDILAPLIAIVLALIYYGSRKVLKKPVTPIMLIVIAACLGVAVYGI